MSECKQKKQEEAKRKAEIMRAYAEGKPIEYYDTDTDEWTYCEYPKWQWGTAEYRIKPSKTLRPYTKDEMYEAMKIHGTYVSIKGKEGIYNVSYFNDSIVNIGATRCDNTYEWLAERCEWCYDKTPCGVEVEE